MKPELQGLPLIDNSGSHRFELTVNHATAFVEYGDRPEAIALFHTEVPPQLEGQGVGSALVEKVLAEVERRQRQLIPLCPFVTSYLKRHPEWQRPVISAGSSQRHSSNSWPPPNGAKAGKSQRAAA